MKLSLESLGQALEHTLTVMGVGISGAPQRMQADAFDPADVSSRLTVAASEDLVVIMAADERTAARMASAISGETVRDEDELGGDTIGEILNVVVGTAQPRGAREFSVPSIVREKGHRLELPAGEVEHLIAHTPCGPLRLYRVVNHGH
jgi:hypothetical protein